MAKCSHLYGVYNMSRGVLVASLYCIRGMFGNGGPTRSVQEDAGTSQCVVNPWLRKYWCCRLWGGFSLAKLSWSN